MIQKIVTGIVAIGVVLGLSSIPAYAADTDNYTITDYQVDMKLGRDSEKRSTLEVAERITAQFPSYDQNHGLERIFVKEYDGHSTDFKLLSVTDENNTPLSYHWEGDALRIGDANKYVHGTQTYVINYTQRDVTRFYKDTEKNEFYWDVIGVEWRVPIQQATFNLTIDQALANNVQTELQCYAGDNEKNNVACDIAPSEEEGAQYNYSVSVKSLRPAQGLTVALGFDASTFVGYKYSPLEELQRIQELARIPVTIIAGIITLIGTVVFFVRTSTSKKKLGTIVPEYLPPKECSVTTAGYMLSGMARSVGPAQLVDFAVRRYITLREVKPKSFWSQAEYEIEILRDVNDLTDEEKEIFSDMFGTIPAVGAKLNLKSLQNNVSYSMRVQDNLGKMQKLVRGSYGLREKDPSLQHNLLVVAGVLALLALLAWWFVPVIGAAILLMFAALSYKSTEKGIALERYLKGLKMYIQVGEAERLRYLQSPEGAEKIHEVVDGTDTPAKRVVLYEKVLPYAILFGQEKEWSKQLGSLYDEAGQQPGWYHSSTGAWSAAAFASSMSSISTSTASSASSSAGGSSGGGSSGGGGGGGGGGGW